MEATKILVFTNVTLIDGIGHKPIQKTIVTIKSNRFQHVGSEISYPEDADVINLHNLIVMPGLIGRHVHLGGLTVDKPGVFDGKIDFL